MGIQNLTLGQVSKLKNKCLDTFFDKLLSAEVDKDSAEEVDFLFFLFWLPVSSESLGPILDFISGSAKLGIWELGIWELGIWDGSSEIFSSDGTSADSYSPLICKILAASRSFERWSCSTATSPKKRNKNYQKIENKIKVKIENGRLFIKIWLIFII